MVTFTIGGASATPMAFIDEKGNSGILDTITNKWTEDIARARATMTMGGTLTIALFCYGRRHLQAVRRCTAS